MMTPHPLPWTKMPEKYSRERYVVLDANGDSVVSGATEHEADQLVALSEGRRLADYLEINVHWDLGGADD